MYFIINNIPDKIFNICAIFGDHSGTTGEETFSGLKELNRKKLINLRRQFSAELIN